MHKFMKVPQLFYQLIYQSKVNYLLRNINYLFCSFLKIKLQIPPSGYLKIKTASGIMKIATNQTSYLTQLIFWNGYKKFEYSPIFEELTKSVSFFLDIGSNIGYYALLAAKSNPNITVFAFEPANGPKFYLNKNIELNELQNSITPIYQALSSTIGDIDFYEVENVKYKYLKYNLAGEGNAGTKTTSRNFVKNIVKATTLKEFVNLENLTQVDLIKIDTEGTEIDILNSGKSIIKLFQPIIICETLFDTIEDELDTFFKALDYLFFNHTKKGLEKVSTIKRKKDNGVRNCFFVPKSKLNLITEFVAKI
jgi:FkbM family methyltransferase